MSQQFLYKYKKNGKWVPVYGEPIIPAANNESSGGEPWPFGFLLTFFLFLSSFAGGIAGLALTLVLMGLGVKLVFGLIFTLLVNN